jgi:hypothetical protein
MSDYELAAPTPTAVWACRSWFCLHRGPFWVKTLTVAQRAAASHRELRFLGLFGHDAMARPGRGQTFLAFLRQMGLAPQAVKR